MKNRKRAIFIMIIPILLSGCSNTRSPNIDPVEMANREFQDQMREIASETVSYLKRSDDIISSSDPETDWVEDIDKNDPINQKATLGFINGIWTGSFGKLIEDIAARSGYSFIDLLNDERILSYHLTLSASNSTLIELLYTGYSNVPNSQINLIVRQESKNIILRNKCEYGDACDGLRKLSNGTPRIPN